MYRCFDLENISFDNFAEWYKIGFSLFEENTKLLKSTLEKFIKLNEVLDDSKMETDWFPLLDNHIFISHSHNDRETVIVIALTGYLYKTLGLKSFIDSCVWGNATDLLKIIDDEYCLNSNNNNYNYQKRNYSTSHVHMMLSSALTKMIDKTECIFFYNTPQSISSADVISRTESPWIYIELTMTQLLRHNLPQRRKQREIEMFSEGGMINEQLGIEYEVNLAHLTKINTETIISWKSICLSKDKKAEDALDALYDLKPIKQKNL